MYLQNILKNIKNLSYFKYCNRNNILSLSRYLIFIFSLPMILLTNFKNIKRIRITSMLLLNVYIRLLYPSCYFPATQSIPGLISHPLTARIIAFIAEFGMYEIWSDWINIDFWYGDKFLWEIVFFGEIVSTLGVIIQSEFLLIFEDFIWCVHTFYMSYLSFPYIFSTFFFMSFGIFLIVFHLPKRIRLLIKRSRCDIKESSIFYINPLFFSNNKVKINMPSKEEEYWIVPMLLIQPIITAFMYYSIDQTF